jgi:hypothetical protein
LKVLRQALVVAGGALEEMADLDPFRSPFDASLDPNIDEYLRRRP